MNSHIVNTDLAAVELCDNVARTNLTMYLGVKFDCRLCFNKEHVDHMMAKARKGLLAIRFLAAASIEQWLMHQGLALLLIEYTCNSKRKPAAN